MALSKIDVANMLTGVTPVANGGTATTSYTPGITMADQWRLTTDFTGIANPITSNLEQNDSSGNGVPIGSSMTESSGVFTFPSTGIYMIIATLQGRGNDGATGVADSEFRLTIKVTTDNSTYNEVGFNATGVASGAYGASTCHYVFDVTDTSTHKCSFRVFNNVSPMTHGDSSKNETHFTFIRLGDT
jgi:hypothetical protein